jgi:hypothetical protein
MQARSGRLLDLFTRGAPSPHALNVRAAPPR